MKTHPPSRNATISERQHILARIIVSSDTFSLRWAQARFREQTGNLIVTLTMNVSKYLDFLVEVGAMRFIVAGMLCV